MIDKIEVGKKYKYGLETITVTYKSEQLVVYKYLKNERECTTSTNYALKKWNEIERETITLTEYVCNCGRTGWLTDEKEFIEFSNTGNTLNGSIAYPNKCHKAPNARSYKVYADTLEPVGEPCE